MYPLWKRLLTDKNLRADLCLEFTKIYRQYCADPESVLAQLRALHAVWTAEPLRKRTLHFGFLRLSLAQLVSRSEAAGELSKSVAWDVPITLVDLMLQQDTIKASLNHFFEYFCDFATMTISNEDYVLICSRIYHIIMPNSSDVIAREIGEDDWKYDVQFSRSGLVLDGHRTLDRSMFQFALLRYTLTWCATATMTEVNDFLTTLYPMVCVPATETTPIAVLLQKKAKNKKVAVCRQDMVALEDGLLVANLSLDPNYVPKTPAKSPRHYSTSPRWGDPNSPSYPPIDGVPPREYGPPAYPDLVEPAEEPEEDETEEEDEEGMNSLFGPNSLLAGILKKPTGSATRKPGAAKTSKGFQMSQSPLQEARRKAREAQMAPSPTFSITDLLATQIHGVLDCLPPVPNDAGSSGGDGLSIDLSSRFSGNANKSVGSVSTTISGKDTFINFARPARMTEKPLSRQGVSGEGRPPWVPTTSGSSPQLNLSTPTSLSDNRALISLETGLNANANRPSLKAIVGSYKRNKYSNKIRKVSSASRRSQSVNVALSEMNANPHLNRIIPPSPATVLPNVKFCGKPGRPFSVVS